MEKLKSLLRIVIEMAMTVIFTLKISGINSILVQRLQRPIRFQGPYRSAKL